MSRPGRTSQSEFTAEELLDFERPVVAEYTALAADLRDAVDGEVQFDEYAQIL
jgi:hypothetical protein